MVQLTTISLLASLLALTTANPLAPRNAISQCGLQVCLADQKCCEGPVGAYRCIPSGARCLTLKPRAPEPQAHSVQLGPGPVNFCGTTYCVNPGETCCRYPNNPICLAPGIPCLAPTEQDPPQTTLAPAVKPRAPEPQTSSIHLGPGPVNFCGTTYCGNPGEHCCRYPGNPVCLQPGVPCLAPTEEDPPKTTLASAVKPRSPLAQDNGPVNGCGPGSVCAQNETCCHYPSGPKCLAPGVKCLAPTEEGHQCGPKLFCPGAEVCCEGPVNSFRCLPAGGVCATD